MLYRNLLFEIFFISGVDPTAQCLIKFRGFSHHRSPNPDVSNAFVPQDIHLAMTRGISIKEET